MFEEWEEEYSTLLADEEWRIKRKIILKRDDNTCKDCGAVSESNHVHHEYYIRSMMPWQVPNDCLVTLCEICHDKRHKDEEIPWYDLLEGKLTFILPNCDKCKGRGHISQYKHIQNGKCFKCWGKGYTTYGLNIVTHERIFKPK